MRVVPLTGVWHLCGAATVNHESRHAAILRGCEMEVVSNNTTRLHHTREMRRYECRGVLSSAGNNMIMQLSICESLKLRSWLHVCTSSACSRGVGLTWLQVHSQRTQMAREQTASTHKGLQLLKLRLDCGDSSFLKSRCVVISLPSTSQQNLAKGTPLSRTCAAWGALYRASAGISRSRIWP